MVADPRSKVFDFFLRYFLFNPVYVHKEVEKQKKSILVHAMYSKKLFIYLNLNKLLFKFKQITIQI